MNRPRIYCTDDLKRLPMRADVDRRNNRRAMLVCAALLTILMIAGAME